MRQRIQHSRPVFILLLFLLASACGDTDVAEETTDRETRQVATDSSGADTVPADDAEFADLEDPDGALTCSPPGNKDAGTTATVGPQPGAIVNNPSQSGAVRPSKVGYKQNNGASSQPHNLKEIAESFPASQTTIPFGRITVPELGYSGCQQWEKTLTLYYSHNGKKWKIWSKDSGSRVSGDSVFIGAVDPLEPPDSITEPDSTGVDIRTVKTRFALGTS